MTEPVATAEALLEQQLSAIAARESVIRAFVPGTFDEGRIRADFAAAAERDPNAPLLGHLLGVKDIFHVDGLPTRAGATIDPAEWAGEQAPTVTALLDAGAIVAGKTVTTELACWRPGPTTNPHDPRRTPGGSSSGSAAGVGGGLFTIGFASQTIGSTIRPAAFCGAVGWKPTRGRISLAGMIPYSASIDHTGFITADVATLTTVLALVTDAWVAAPSRLPTRLAVPVGRYLDALDRDAGAGFARSRSALEASGVEIVEIPTFDDVAELDDLLERFTYAEAAVVHEHRMELLAEHCDPRFVADLRAASTMTTTERDDARRRADRLSTDLDAALRASDADAWLTPSATGVAPVGLEFTGSPAMNGVWTFAGLPTITVPHGHDDHGLPFGLQITGRCNGDEAVVSIAGALDL